MSKGKFNCKIEAGETYLISGANCDDENGYVYGEYKVLWFDDVFVLWGVEGCWPNLNKREHISIKGVSR